MNTHCTPTSLDNSKINEERRLTIEFWSRLHIGGDPGETTWEVLDPLELQVTEYLDCDPPNIKKAVSLTVKAALLIEGCSDL